MCALGVMCDVFGSVRGSLGSESGGAGESVVGEYVPL